MNLYNTARLAALIGIVLLSIAFQTNLSPKVITTTPKPVKAKIQVAILLDVSNSMDGLIEQAKAQLWNMVSVMGTAKCNNLPPEITIALYEYGRSNNDVKRGYVKQLSDFTTNLDQLSQTLFTLKTYGGEEYCGQVLYSSLQELKWDSSSTNYKVIFIAGNEDFLQGNTSWTKACAEAAKKGVIINTIYCGDKMQGTREHWNLGGECGSGSYTNINQDAKMDDIPTPYDSMLFSLNNQLNKTYIAYGSSGTRDYEKQEAVDQMNYSMNKSVAAKRVAVKGKKELYKNTQWDLVDAIDQDSLFVSKVDMKTLPDSLKTKTREEIKKIVRIKTKQRGDIQQQISTTSVKREQYLAAKKASRSGNPSTATLETEIEKIIRQQAKRFNLLVP